MKRKTLENILKKLNKLETAANDMTIAIYYIKKEIEEKMSGDIND